MTDSVFHIDDIGKWEAGHNELFDEQLGICLCRSGQAELLVDDRFFRIGANCLLLLPPYSRIQLLRRDSAFGGLCLGTNIGTLQAYTAQFSMEERLRIRRHPCLRTDGRQCLRLEHAMRVMHILVKARRRDRGQGAARTNGPFVQAMLGTFYFEVMRAYLDRTPAADAPQSATDRLLEEFLQLLGLHCARERTVDFYARRLHLSPGYLSAVVKAKTGRSAMQWITAFAIMEARHYLHTTSWSIKEIAIAMHFPDQSTFGRYFRQHSGLSPTEFRKSASHGKPPRDDAPKPRRHEA